MHTVILPAPDTFLHSPSTYAYVHVSNMPQFNWGPQANASIVSLRANKFASENELCTHSTNIVNHKTLTTVCCACARVAGTGRAMAAGVPVSAQINYPKFERENVFTHKRTYCARKNTWQNYHNDVDVERALFAFGANGEQL